MAQGSVAHYTVNDSQNKALQLVRPVSSLQTLQQFFILGAAKAGTTSLHSWLSQHPDVLMSNPKEPYFFEAEFEWGLDFYRNRYFKGWDGKKLLGDARHRNLYFSYIPKRIYDSCPQARFIVLLRNPVDRAYSHWWHCYRMGEDILPFAQAVQEDAQRIARGEGIGTAEEIEHYAKTLGPRGISAHRTYLDTGYYAEQLERYLRYFPREQFHVILFDELAAQPAATFAGVCDFLGLQRVSLDTTLSAMNRSGRLRWRYAKREIMRRFIDTLIRHPTRIFSASGRRSILKQQPLDVVTRAWLAQHFQSHNAKLESLLGRRLPNWDTVTKTAPKPGLRLPREHARPWQAPGTSSVPRSVVGEFSARKNTAHS